MDMHKYYNISNVCKIILSKSVHFRILKNNNSKPLTIVMISFVITIIFKYLVYNIYRLQSQFEKYNLKIIRLRKKKLFHR